MLGTTEAAQVVASRAVLSSTELVSLEYRANKSVENVSQFKYLGMMVTNHNVIQEEIKRRLVLQCLLTFDAEFSIFVCAVEKHKN
jgi:hypothetical protein